MGRFISMMIMTQADNSLENGQAKYRAYFVKTKLYVKWQIEVNNILSENGYSGCIVTK